MTETHDHDITAVEVGPDDPATDVDVETLRAGLASDDESIRLKAANVASFVPHDEVETLKSVLPELRDCLSAEYMAVTNLQAAIAVKIISEDDPTLLEDAVPRLVEMLAHENSLVRSTTASCLANVAMERPEYVATEVDALVAATLAESEEAIPQEALKEGDFDRSHRATIDAINMEEGVRNEVAREVAANLLVEVADHDPSLVVAHLDDLIDALDSAANPIRLAIADIVASVAKANPADATDAVDPLCNQLDHDAESYVATCVTALGFIGDDRAVEPLEALADDEQRSEDLRDLAAETAAFIRENQ